MKTWELLCLFISTLFIIYQFFSSYFLEDHNLILYAYVLRCGHEGRHTHFLLISKLPTLRNDHILAVIIAFVSRWPLNNMGLNAQVHLYVDFFPANITLTVSVSLASSSTSSTSSTYCNLCHSWDSKIKPASSSSFSDYLTRRRWEKNTFMMTYFNLIINFLPYYFLSIFISLAYFIVRIQYIIRVLYKICVNWLFVLSEMLSVNSRLLVVKVLGSWNLYTDFWLWRGLVPITPMLYFLIILSHFPNTYTVDITYVCCVCTI